MTSPENIINVLKSCSRGKLTYERQSSFSPKQEKSSNQSLKHSLIPDASTLAGSLADVSSVLEDVTSEMSDLQLKRIGHVIDKIKNKEKIDKKAEEIEEI